MLSPDVSATRQAVTSYLDSEAPINAYLLAVIEIPLGPQPLVVNGQDAGSFDPLDGFPGLADALHAARSHGLDFQNDAAQPLHIWAIVTVPGFDDQFQTETATILNVITQLGATGTPTAAQREAVFAALQTLNAQLSDGRSQLTAIQSAVTLFLDRLSADHQVLVGGSSSIGASITRVKQAVFNEALQASVGPFGTEMADLIGTIGDQMVQSLQSVQDALDKAAAANEGLGAAMSDLASAVETLLAKYDAVLGKVQSAKLEQFAGVLQELDIEVARTAWTQLAGFISASGL